MKPALETLLIDCLDALERGETIESILARYPQEAAELRPMLETAEVLAQFNWQPSLAAQAQSRRIFLDQAATLEQQSRRTSPMRRLQQRLWPLLSLVVLLLVIGTGLFTAATTALPDDALYEVKLLGETARLMLATDAGSQASLVEQFRRERIREIEMLLLTDRDALVSFAGPIGAIGEDAWMIAGLETKVNEATQIAGEPHVGLWAEVSGRVQDGTLTAGTITVEPGSDEPPSLPVTEQVETTPTAEVTATAVSTVTATTTSTATASATATATATSSPTATTQSTPTHTPSPTASPTVAVATETIAPTSPPVVTDTPLPPATQPPDDNDNQNDNDDNGNDNQNDNDDNGNDNDNDNNDDNSGNDNNNGGGNSGPGSGDDNDNGDD